MNLTINKANYPAWKEVSTSAKLPAKLGKLQELARNVYWSWHTEVTDLFDEIDHDLWVKSGKNPVLFLNSINIEKLDEVVKNTVLLNKIDKIYDIFSKYVNTPKDPKKSSVAYFSMEYGLTDVLKIYSGGLGVLAGDYVKEASDCNINMTAVGFLYRFGYFTQTLSMDGDQIANYEAQNFNNIPVSLVKDANGNADLLEVPYHDRIIYANIWKVAVGRVNLYLMDTDIDKNSEFDRSITHALYGGDWENRLKQEYLLGIGGIIMLKKLGIKHDIYHCNEGHAALINVQRLNDYIHDEGLSFLEAFEVVRSSALYTVHTPVPAGHDKFDEGLFSKYMYHYAEKLGISWDDLMNLGRENHDDKGEKFSMSVFACNTCQEVNGVSWLHGEVSKKMFAPIWKGYFWEESHVGYVTNGVHMPSWANPAWKKLFEESFGSDFYNDQSNMKIWEKIYNVPDEKIWETRKALKNKLFDIIRVQYKDNWLRNQGDPQRILSILDSINPNALTIGFGRRFATYKRAHLLFTDLKRLAEIVNNPVRPVQFIFTGKAHPADGGGKGLIRRIIEISRQPEFLGKIIFLENYDIALAKGLIAGVDIWLNTPTRPLEASGTSGEKALMNGVVNFSVKDGWWYEGYREGAGWALTDKRTYENQGHQDQLDAATIYKILETEIVPTYYAINSKGYSPEWIQTIKNSIAQIAPNYTMKRMLDDYIERFYAPLTKRKASIIANQYAKAKEIAAWKKSVVEAWDQIEVISAKVSDKLTNNAEVGDTYTAEVVLDSKGLGDSLGVDFVSIQNVNNVEKLDEVKEMELYKKDGSKLYFKFEDRVSSTGTFKYAFRMFPKNKDLAHRQDFCYVRWF